MKKIYVAKEDFWLGARLVAKGEEVALTEGQMKYMAHAVEAKAEPKPVEKPAPKKAPAKE